MKASRCFFVADYRQSSIGLADELTESASAGTIDGVTDESASGWVEICPGIRRRTLVTGEKLYQMIARLDAGSQLPEHAHPQEQITHVLRGRLRLVVGGIPHDLSPGQSCHIASGVAHSAETLEETLALDTFSPPRTDYLARDLELRNA